MLAPTRTVADPNTQLSRLSELVSARLRIQRLGLAEALRQFEAGQLADVLVTLEKLDEDSLLLQRRLADETQRSKPSSKNTPQSDRLGSRFLRANRLK